MRVQRIWIRQNLYYKLWNVTGRWRVQKGEYGRIKTFKRRATALRYIHEDKYK